MAGTVAIELMVHVQRSHSRPIHRLQLGETTSCVGLSNLVQFDSGRIAGGHLTSVVSAPKTW
jgi:hypothetical protein